MGLQLYVPEVNRTPDDFIQAFSTADKERRARIVDRQLSPFESPLQAARSAGGEGPYRDNQ
jgi:hypothetical protein